jgi:hypothetical protein
VFTTGTDTFLGSCSAVVGALIKTQKNVFKLVHPRICEQQGWVIPWHYWAGWDNLMAFLGEVVQVRLANLRDFHANNYRIGTSQG